MASRVEEWIDKTLERPEASDELLRHLMLNAARFVLEEMKYRQLLIGRERVVRVAEIERLFGEEEK